VISVPLMAIALTVALLIWGIGASIGWLADRYGPNRVLLLGSND
jgi:MFS family permease